MIIQRLKDGNKAFREGYFRQNKTKYMELVKKGQSPKILFIACSDSRISPSIITSSDLGELFTVRNVGNFVPPFKFDYDFHGTATAIEYAVLVLKVENIIVCGHSYCGACASLFEDIDNKDMVHTKKWLTLGNNAKEEALEKFKDKGKNELLRGVEKISIKYQLKNLLSYPIVKDRVNNGELNIFGMYYNLDNGSLNLYNSDKDIFKEL